MQTRRTVSSLALTPTAATAGILAESAAPDARGLAAAGAALFVIGAAVWLLVTRRGDR